MPVTRTEQRTAEKRKAADANQKRQKAFQDAKIVRDRKLGQLGDDRAAAQRSLDDTHRAAVRKTWDEFRTTMQRIRRDQRKDPS